MSESEKNSQTDKLRDPKRYKSPVITLESLVPPYTARAEEYDAGKLEAEFRLPGGLFIDFTRKLEQGNPLSDAELRIAIDLLAVSLEKGLLGSALEEIISLLKSKRPDGQPTLSDELKAYLIKAVGAKREFIESVLSDIKLGSKFDTHTGRTMAHAIFRRIPEQLHVLELLGTLSQPAFRRLEEPTEKTTPLGAMERLFQKVFANEKTEVAPTVKQTREWAEKLFLDLCPELLSQVFLRAEGERITLALVIYIFKNLQPERYRDTLNNIKSEWMHRTYRAFVEQNSDEQVAWFMGIRTLIGKPWAPGSPTATAVGDLITNTQNMLMDYVKRRPDDVFDLDKPPTYFARNAGFFLLWAKEEKAAIMEVIIKKLREMKPERFNLVMACWLTQGRNSPHYGVYDFIRIETAQEAFSKYVETWALGDQLVFFEQRIDLREGMYLKPAVITHLKTEVEKNQLVQKLLDDQLPTYQRVVQLIEKCEEFSEKGFMQEFLVATCKALVEKPTPQIFEILISLKKLLNPDLWNLLLESLLPTVIVKKIQGGDASPELFRILNIVGRNYRANDPDSPLSQTINEGLDRFSPDQKMQFMTNWMHSEVDQV